MSSPAPPDHKHILTNSALSVVQIAVQSILYFVLYRYMVGRVGVAGLGLWSLAQSYAAVSQIGDLGLSGSAVKYVAQYRARGDGLKVRKVLETTLTSMGLIVAVLLTAFYLTADWLFGLAVSAAEVAAVKQLLPMIIVGIWFYAVMLVVEGGLEGHQRVDLRAVNRMTTTVFYVVSAILLMPAYGLYGLALAYGCQYLVGVLVGSWMLWKHTGVVIRPLRWDGATFREMLGYGAGFQTITLISILMGPLIKSLLARASGTELVGIYEVANQFVLRVRSLLVSAMQALIPTVADRHERSPQQVVDLYRQMMPTAFLTATPIFALVNLAAPALSLLVFSVIDPFLIWIVLIIGLGYYLNTLSTVAYTIFLGVGRLRWNIVGWVIQPVGLLASALVFGSALTGIGVLVVRAVLQVAGGALAVIGFYRDYQLQPSWVFPAKQRGLVGVYLLALLAGGSTAVWRDWTVTTVTYALSALLILAALWRHPDRAALQARLWQTIRRAPTAS